MAKTRKKTFEKLRPGKRHTLLVYQRTMDRLWKATLPLGLLMTAIWRWSYLLMPSLKPPYDAVFFVGGLVVLVISLFALLARKMNYVQAFPDHLRLATPFLKIKISYRRVITTQTTQFRQLFPPEKDKWANRQFFEPIYNKTVLTVDLTSYPMRKGLLRLFFPRTMFSPRKNGLVLAVNDWMALSTEIDSLRTAWYQNNSQVFI